MPQPTAPASPAISCFVVLPWSDPVVEVVGFDPRSRYVELFWLSVLGPTTTLLLRRLADGFDSYPDGFELDLGDTARSLGLQLDSTRGSAFSRALERMTVFGMARTHSHGLCVRRCIPPLSQRQVDRLPPSLRDAHASWVDEPRDDVRTVTRARVLAQALLGVGDEAEVVERQLVRLDVEPADAARAMAWARDELVGAAG